MRNRFAPIPKNLARRTPGEALWLSRKGAGLTAVEAAALAGVGVGRYRDAERDRDPARIASLGRFLVDSAPTLPLLLALARRRSGFGFAATAKALSISRVTLSAAERRGDPALVRFWRKRGFRFPRAVVN